MATTVPMSPVLRDLVIETDLRGHCLLEDPSLNKDTAFSEAEREELGLLGLLPPHVTSLDVQAQRVYEAYQAKDTDLERHIFLRALQDTNEVLFYRLLDDHIAEMMPIVYTPVVGTACQRFCHIYRRPRGLFVPYSQRDSIPAILRNAPRRHDANVEVIVVTDGERILGLGDQGAGGMGIPIGKLSLYTLCAGIDPAVTLPILLDVGTDNAANLVDPLYLGWRHERIRGADYDAFVEQFVQALEEWAPFVLLQWEDFGKDHARRLLDRYRNRLCTFNDDLQGTAAVTVAGLLAAVRSTGARLGDQRVLIVGAGTAGVGIADLLVKTMEEEGMSRSDALSCLLLVGRDGPLVAGASQLTAQQRPYAWPAQRFEDWGARDSLEQVVRHARPTVLIGVCAHGGIFTEQVIRTMREAAPRPIVFALSNPNSSCEADPHDVLRWTDGMAVVATGSPYDPWRSEGREVSVAQCNNAYVFPGVGLGVLAARARRVTDGMFMAAARALADLSPALHAADAPLFPPLAAIREVSRTVARAVALAAQAEGVAPEISETELQLRIAQRMWMPRYPRVRPRERRTAPT